MRKDMLAGLAFAALAASGCTTDDAGLGLPATAMAPTPRPEIASQPVPETVTVTVAEARTPRGRIDRLIAHYASAYAVPEELVHHVVKRESNYNPAARHRGNYGLMQIKPATARSMGYGGEPAGLLDPDTNLRYAVKYLRGAWLVAEGSAQRADWLYRTGYYYDAKRKGLLAATGLKGESAVAEAPRAPAAVPAATAVAALPGGEPPATAFSFAGQTPSASPLPSPRPTM